MAGGIEFPAYVKLEHQQDASTEAAFVAAVDSMMARASQSVTNFAENAKRQLDGALSVKRNEAGALDLGVEEMRQAAQAQQLRAVAAREVASAALAAAKAQGTYSQEDKEAIATSRALATAEEQKAAAMLRSAEAAQRVQAQLNQQSSQVTNLTGSFLALARAEAAAADGAQMLAAISAGTGLDRMAKSARESAAAFEAMFAAQERSAAGASQLRAQLDPMFAAQQRFNAAMDQADDLLRAGAITTREYAQAQQFARDNLQQHAQSLFQVEEAQKRGTTAQGNVINSVRASRVAFVQLGQQMQDVTVQAQMGTSAFTIFTQQVPQAAFALSGLADSANKTQARIGAMATFLSGPWGAAIFAATAVLGPFIYGLFKSSQAADGAGKSLADLVEKKRQSANEARAAAQAEDAFRLTLDGVTDSIERNRKAIQDLNSVKKTSAELALFNAERTRAEAIVLQFNTQQQLLNAAALLQAQMARASGPGEANERASLGLADRAARVEELAKQFTQSAASITAAEAAITRARAAVSVERGQSGDEGRINRMYDTMVDRAREAAIANGEVAESLERQVAAIEKARDAELKRTQSQQRATATTRTRAESLPAVTGAEIARALGAPVISGKRSAANNDRVGGAKNSYHLTDQAIDIPLSVNGKPFTKAGIREALAPLGVEIKELLGPGDKGHNDHFHIAFGRKRLGPDKVADQATKALEDQRKEAEKLVEALAKVGQTFDAYVARPAEAAAAIGDLVEESERRLQIEQLITQGRETEVQVLQTIWQIESRIGSMTQAQKDNVRQIVEYEEARLEVMRRQQDQIGMYLDATRSIRGELESFFAGEGANFGRIARRLQAQFTVEQLFGPALRGIESDVKSQFGQSVDELATTTDKAESALDDLADVVAGTANRIRTGGPSVLAGPGAATSALSALVGGGSASLAAMVGKVRGPGGEIVVQGGSGKATLAGMKPEEYFDLVGKRLAAPLIEQLEALGIKLPSAIQGALGGALGGYAAAGPVGAVLGGLKGLDLKGPIGDAIGKAFGGAVTGGKVDAIFDSLGVKSSKTGASIGGAIGSLIPIPGGQIIGSIAGGLLGGALKSTKRGSAIIGGSGDGLGVSGFYGNSSSRKDQAGGLAGSAVEAVNRLAKQLGASVDASRGKVSIGVREDKLVVDPQGRGYTKTSKFSDLKDFGDDAEAAIAFAVKNLIEDGVLKGLKASEERLLRAGDDIEAAMQDVLDFRSVFQRLKAYKDPVGAALDELDTEFNRLTELFTRAGASAAEFSQLEELYGIERAQAIEEASNRVVGSLRSLLDDLNTGDLGLSLRDRRANLLGEYNGLRGRVDAGDVTAFDQYDEVSRKLLEIERELFGSQAGYFDRFFEVKNTAGRAVSEQDRLAQLATDRDSPFRDNAGDGAKPVVDSIHWLGDHLVTNLGGQFQGLTDALAQLAARIPASNTNIGGGRVTPQIRGELAY